MNALREFFTPEAGQRRRAWLDGVDARIANALRHALGPHGYPVVEGAARGANMLMGGADHRDAVQASGDLMGAQSGWDAAQAAGTLGAATMGALMPGVSARAVREGTEAAADGIRAFHGSPHDFDRFDLSKIGTGEGAQAYGHGLYFAENEGVARQYRDALRFPRQSSTDSSFTRVLDDLNYHRGDDANLRRNYEAMLSSRNPEAARMAQENLSVIDEVMAAHPGHMYEVNIRARPEDFLDWDAPFSGQPRQVQGAITDQWRRLGGTTEGRTLPPFAAREDAPMESILAAMSTSQPGRKAGAAEGALRDAGIPGIRYLDAGSRGAGDGSRNYVVFDDSIIDIVRKYGVAGAATMLGLSAAQVEAGVADYDSRESHWQQAREYLRGLGLLE
jgi:hypothetical protein